MRSILPVVALLAFGCSNDLYSSDVTSAAAIKKSAWSEFTKYLNDASSHRELEKMKKYIHPKLFTQMDRSFESLSKSDPTLTKEDLYTSIALDLAWRMQWILSHEVSLKDEYACIGLIFREYGELRHGIVVLTEYSGRWVIEDSFINVQPENAWEFEDSDGPHSCHQAEWNILGTHNKSFKADAVNGTA